MTAPAPAGRPTSLVELRLLDGPNLYFPRAAVRLTLDVAALAALPPAAVRRAAADVGLARVRPGEPGSWQRALAVQRVLRYLVRRLAAESGTTRLAVRVRTGAGDDRVVLAYPWRSEMRARALGEGVAAVVDAAAAGEPVADAVQLAAQAAADAHGGRSPAAIRARVPVASITGTNGKTTTTRLLAHLSMTAGRRTAWSSTDGVVAMGEVVQPGDYSGPSGARQVLAVPGVQVGILETARGGLLLRGMGVVANDVSVVTNVSADHLGMQGVDTVDQLAEVKAIVTRVTRPRGWTVLNGDDPRVLAMRACSPGRPFVFSLDPWSPALREAQDAGGRAITVVDGDVAVLTAGEDADRLLPVVDVPLTLAGLSTHNVANALAATAAALGLGLPRDAVVAGLRSFRPDPALNPGRMNTYTVPVDGGEATVVLDMAHNEAGFDALLDVAHGLRAPGSRVLLALGTAGDRSDEMLTAIGELGGRRADRVEIVHKEKYLRGRDRDEMGGLIRAGAAAVGVHDVPEHESELAGAMSLLAEAGPGDVVAVTAGADREEIAGRLLARGGSEDSPERVRAKVFAARGEHPREAEIAAAGREGAALRLALVRELRSTATGTAADDARLVAEEGLALEASGETSSAVGLLERALADGLVEPHRSTVRLHLARAQRTLGDPEAALAALDALLADRPAATAARAARALVLHDLGRHDEALAAALAELAEHLPAPEGSTLRADAAALAPPTP